MVFLVLPDGKYCAAWVKTLIFSNPVFVSGIGVGPAFKGVKQFDTAALEFDFQSFSLSYDFVRTPSHCIYSGCSKCL